MPQKVITQIKEEAPRAGGPSRAPKVPPPSTWTSSQFRRKQSAIHGKIEYWAGHDTEWQVGGFAGSDLFKAFCSREAGDEAEG